ncbi:MAG: hypothetical protein HY093_01555 [Candidatus Liptonbacteria bacterium]|nr:hypothetical protein [Candidatus Liptonbacteria bacterium]
MNKSRYPTVSLLELNQKLDAEAKRLVREKEEGIVKYVSKVANLNGNSRMVFKRKSGAEVTLSFRLNADGNIRLAYEKQV